MIKSYKYNINETAGRLQHQRDLLRAELNQTKGNTEEAKIIETNLSFLRPDTITKMDKKQEKYKNAFMAYFEEELPKLVGAEISDNLGVKESKRSLRTEENEQRLQKIKEKWKNKTTVPYQDYKEIYERFIKVLTEVEKNKDSDILIKYVKDVDAFKTRIKTYYYDIKTNLKEKQPEFLKEYNTGNFGYRKDLDKKNNWENFINDIIIMKYLLVTEDISQILGNIGELAIAKGLEIINSEIDKQSDELILKASGKVVGEDTSEKIYISSSKFFKNSKTGVAVDFSNTQDKVDIELQYTDDDSKNRTFSIKNYPYLNHLKILEGNGYPILTMYPNFLRHYISLLYSISNKEIAENEERNPSFYNTIKSTIGVHALIGGVLAKKEGNIIKTKKADYFAVNVREGTDKGIKVYSTKDLGKRIITNPSEGIDLVASSKRNAKRNEIMKSLQGISYSKIDSNMITRFSNLQVILHMEQLKKQINK